MATKKFKPTSPGRRFQTVSTFEEITQAKPTKALLRPIRKQGGRNNLGRTTVRHRGGGHKRHYRVIDFKRDKFGVPGTVETIEYDPNRNALIALIKYADGERRYILAAKDCKVGDQVMSGEQAPVRPGNTLPINNIPLGTIIHNIELRPKQGGIIVRSAGAGAQLLAKEGKYAQIKLPSGEVRKVLMTCLASIGQIGNEHIGSVSYGKAGRKRWLGFRPKVRGVAMNPIDHPHGGGEGKTSGGRHPVTPWGVPTKGHRTRRKKLSDNFIVRRRHKKR